tara:strand:+ start:279 stop:464 length:186 start_codon:yes stop_codon:yes gene_type:complete
MRMKTYAFIGKTYAKKYFSEAKDAIKTLSAKGKKHVKKHKMKYTAGAGAVGGYTASKINKE